METKNLVIDCDAGWDDLANLALFKRECGLKLVVSSYGCTSVQSATTNILSFLSLLDRSDVNIVKGVAEPLSSHPIEGGKLPRFFGDNGFNDIELPHCRIQIPHVNDNHKFEEIIAERLRRYGPVDYFVTGPCTNLARAARSFPKLVKSQIDQIYLVGGALDAQGNAGPRDTKTKKKMAEFNFYLDPIAAESVLGLGVTTNLITWDEAKHFALPESLLRRLNSSEIAGDYLLSSLRKFMAQDYAVTLSDHDQQDVEGPSFKMADPITYFAHMGFGTFEDINISISLEVANYGQVRRSDSGYPVRLFHLGDVEEAIGTMLEVLDLKMEVFDNE